MYGCKHICTVNFKIHFAVHRQEVIISFLTNYWNQPLFNNIVKVSAILFYSSSDKTKVLELAKNNGKQRGMFLLINYIVRKNGWVPVFVQALSKTYKSVYEKLLEEKTGLKYLQICTKYCTACKKHNSVNMPLSL